MAFVADALLLSIAAIGWRGAWVLRARARARTLARASVAELVDRADEMTLGAVLVSLYRYRGLLKALVLKDLKLKYRGSVFGFLWSLANPLLMIVVYTLAFTFILGIRSEMFVFYLMLGQLAWAFFASSAMMSTGSIVDNAGLLRTVLFPRAILPIGTVLFNFAQYLLTIAVFLPLMIALVQDSARRADAAVSRRARAPGRVHDRHRADSRDDDRVLSRRSAPRRSRARRAVLDDAHRLRARSRARAAAAG